MGKNMPMIVVALLLLLVGYFFFTRNTSAPETAMEVETPEAMMEVSAAVILSEQNESGESGSATLVETENGLVVSLSMLGAPEGLAQPAHIHTGTCAEIGGVVYPLESPVNGVSETVLDVTLADLASQMPLAINVHKSEAESSVYTACGDLEL